MIRHLLHHLRMRLGLRWGTNRPRNRAPADTQPFVVERRQDGLYVVPRPIRTGRRAGDGLLFIHRRAR
jgi:hypothetical protein